jgi:peptidoglycan/LPS O-acetylase OafA/YrhL
MANQNAYRQISTSLDTARGIAIILIVAYHLWGSTQGYESLQSILSMARFGSIKDILESFLLTICLLGEQGVDVFLVISGFGLTVSWLRRNQEEIHLRSFWQRRIGRIIPLFWSAIALAIGLWLINPDWATYGGGVWQGNWESTLILLGSTLTTLRNFIPAHFFAINAAWWYIGLAIQLYFVFPFLIRLGQRWSWEKLLIFSLGISLLFRFIIWVLPLEATFTSTWMRGAFFPGRLFEFTIGIILAIALITPAQLHSSLRHFPDWILRRRWLLIHGLVFTLGFLAHHSRPDTLGFGRVFSAPLMGLGEIGLLIQLVLILGAIPVIGQGLTNGLKWIGKYSYGVYLIHMNIYIILWSIFIPILDSYWMRFGVTVAGSVAIGMGFDRLYQWVAQRSLQRKTP